jgi:cytochrome c553
MQIRNFAILSTSLAGLFLMGISAVHAQQATRPGGDKTAHCEHCHGLNGCEPLSGLIPKLCGQNVEYLEMTLIQFRDGSRVSPMMQQTTKTLSDSLIRQLSDYFAEAPTTRK